MIPDTKPVPAPTEALAGKELLHEPPAVASERAVVRPLQTKLLPAIAAGTLLTVTGRVAIQAPGLRVYVMVALPAATPDTLPPEVTVATAVLLLVHAPPVTVLDNVLAVPMHTLPLPVMAAGEALTVTGRKLLQPVAAV